MNAPSWRSTILAGAAFGAVLTTTACSSVDEPDDEPAPVNRATGAPGSDGSDAPAATYTAGDYSAEGSYSTPGGQEKLKVDLTLDADGTITALEVTPEGKSPNSKVFQGKFSSGISDVAVGKSISTLSVDKVAGSSLSSGGFNAALDDIAGQAQG